MVSVLLVLVLLSGTPADGGGLESGAGNLDPSFGAGGEVLTAFGRETNDISATVDAMAIRPDGKIVVAGTTGYGTRVVLARYDENGRLDATFGVEGTVKTALGTDHAAVALQQDGKIVVAGSNGAAFTLMRYQPDGRSDRSFGKSGKVTTAFARSPSANARVTVALDSRQRIVVAGARTRGIALARYRPNGSLDPRFGTHGKVTTGFRGEPAGCAFDRNGRIVAAGGGDYGVELTRYTARGSLDGSFGKGGRLTVTPGATFSARLYSVGGVAVTDDGAIVVTGTGGGLVLVRFDENGELDSSFGAGGVVQTTFGAPLDPISETVVVQPDGKVIAAGQDGFQLRQFIVVRYEPDGSLDTGFGRGGSVTTKFRAESAASVQTIAIQHDGKIVAAGGSGSDFAAARYLGL